MEMTKNMNGLALFLLLTSLSSNSIAELYLWTDAEGNKHFTSYKPPKEATHISVTETSNDNEHKQYKQKVKSTARVVPSAIPDSEHNNPLTKAEEDKIDKEIQALWIKHWKDLNNGDIEAALESYTPSSRKTYRPVLEKLYGSKRK